MENLIEVIGQNIRFHRKSLEMTTTELGQLCDITQGAVSKIERGEVIASIDTIVKICNALRVDLYDILPSDLRPNKVDLVNLDIRRLHILNAIESFAISDIKLLINLISTSMPLLRELNKLDDTQIELLTNLLASFERKSKNV